MRKIFVVFCIVMFAALGFYSSPSQFGGGGFVSSGGGGGSVDSNNFATTNSLRAADSARGLKAISGVSTRIPFYSGGYLTSDAALVFNSGLGRVTSTQFLGDVFCNNISAVSGGLISSGANVAIDRNYLRIRETAGAPSGIATYAYLFADNSGGKTKLMVQFGTGAAQQIAIEP